MLNPFPGRDYDYQTLNLTFAGNAVKFGFIISLFPKPLKLSVTDSIRVSLLLNPVLALFHACYRTFPPKFNKKLNLSDLWLRSDLRRWRNMGRNGPGMINRFVRHCIWNLSHYLAESQNDVLMWLMSEAKGVERSVEGLARRLLLLNLGSIHTTYLASGNIPSPPMLQS
jgi:hypothetical protein